MNLQETPLVSVVIVNYNGAALLPACLASVLAQRYRGMEVIVVDNGSQDASCQIIERDFPDVRLLKQERNLGFSGGANAGVREARSDLVVLLNNDTIVGEGWLAALVRSAQGAQVAVVSSLVITKGIPQKYYERNGSINFLCHNIMRVYSQPENVFYPGGASFLFRRDVLGLPFVDEYFAYGEDVYLGLRARFMGWRIVHENDSVVDHLGSVTSRRARRSYILYLQERNRVLTVCAFFRCSTLIRILPYLALNAVVKFAQGIAAGPGAAMAIGKAYGWILVHPGFILRLRQTLRAERQVEDAAVISWMTSKLTNGESGVGRLINRISEVYCRVVLLRTVETLPEGSR
jgi:GT2 family glycosyltransferase